MPDVLTKEGRAYLVDPYTGASVSVPEKEADEYLSSGFVPASEEQYRYKRGEEKYGGTEGEIFSALAGAGRGLTFGLSDIALTKSGLGKYEPLVSASTMRALKEYNPTMSTVGEVSGTVGGALIPGGPVAKLAGLSAKAGTGVARGAAAMLGREAESFIPRLIGGVTREAIQGATIGAGSSISDIVLSPEEMTTGDMLIRLARGAGSGALFGAGLGTAGAVGGSFGRAVKGKYWINTEKLKALRAEKDVLSTQIEAARSSGVVLPDLEGKLATISSEISSIHGKMVTGAFTRAISYGIGSSLGGGVTGGVLGMIVAPKVIQSLKKALAPLSKKAAEKVGPVISKLTEKSAPVISKLAKAEERLTGMIGDDAMNALMGVARGKVASAVDTAGSWAASKIPQGVFTESITHGVGHAVGALGGELATGLPSAVASGMMVHGLEGAAIGYAAHAIRKPIATTVNAISNAISGTSGGIVKALTSSDYSSIANEIPHVDEGVLELVMRAGAPTNTPQNAVDAAVMNAVNAIRYLKSQSPTSTEDDKRITQTSKHINDVDKMRYERKLRAVMDPDSFIKDFSDNKLTRDHVAAWQAVYPQALDELKKVVRAEVSKVKANGGKYSTHQAAQISMLLGDKAAAPKMYDESKVIMLQQMHVASRNEASPRPRRRGLSVSEKFATPMQRIRG